jgi:hypothetical protein
MNDREKQIEEMANISTKEEIEARNKRGKEKDELRQALLHYATAEASGGIKSLIDCEGCAFYLYENLGYRKVPDDSVVLAIAEVDEFRKDSAEVKFLKKRIQDEARKETAREVIDLIKTFSPNKDLAVIIAKRYGVEV